jgi:hypothetical protein
MDDQLFGSLLSGVRCKHCGQPYEPANTELLGHQGSLWVFSVHCGSCNSRSLAFANVRQGGAPETETHPVEEFKNEPSAPISMYDVLEMHVFLEDFDGDFASIICDR